MTDAQIQLVIGDQTCVPDCVNPRKITYVVTVGFQPANHRVLGVENKGCCLEISGVIRPIVTDLKGPVIQIESASAAVQAMATVVVIGGPRLIRCLKQNIGVAGVVANDPEYLTVIAIIRSNYMGEVDARGSGGRHSP